MDELDVRIDALGQRFSHLQKKMLAQRANSEKRAEQVIAETRGTLARHAEALRHSAGLPERLWKAQLALIARKRAAAPNAVSARESERRSIDRSAALAEDSMEFAEIAIDKAILAFYEAVEKAEQYQKKYNRKGSE